MICDRIDNRPSEYVDFHLEISVSGVGAQPSERFYSVTSIFWVYTNLITYLCVLVLDGIY